VHPDLEELEFGEIGSTNRYVILCCDLFDSELSSSLPPPIRPSAPDSPTERSDQRGTLSDFSDYDSSDEEYLGGASSHGIRNYISQLSDEEDPFADPFADQEVSVSTPGIRERTGMAWH
jgi:hypothetical protein